MHTILVIDDTDEVREILKLSLSMDGFKVITARNGLEGIEKANSFLPDLIICDLNMPKLNGYQTLERLRKEQRTATIPFIYLTGHAEMTNLRRGMDLGADDFLSKPFTPNELLQTVRMRLEKRRQLEARSELVFSELRTHFSLVLPHELRTPLNAVIGYSDMIFEEGSQLTPDELKELAQNINQSGKRLLHLIENFLIYAQLEISGRDSNLKNLLKKVEPTDTKSLVEKMVRELPLKAGRENDLKCNLQESWVNVSAEHLERIIREMVDNALKFSEADHKVTVSGERVGERYRLCVHNEGQGMTPEQIKLIGPHIQFERRLHEQQGIGLGLVIARKLVELYDGDFEIDSAPTEGTKVTILLPVRV